MTRPSRLQQHCSFLPIIVLEMDARPPASAVDRRLDLEIIDMAGVRSSYVLTGRVADFHDELESDFGPDLGIQRIHSATFSALSNGTLSDAYQVDANAWAELADHEAFNSISTHVTEGMPLEAAVRLQVDVFEQVFRCPKCKPAMVWTETGALMKVDECSSCMRKVPPESTTQIEGMSEATVLSPGLVKSAAYLYKTRDAVELPTIPDPVDPKSHQKPAKTPHPKRLADTPAPVPQPPPAPTWPLLRKPVPVPPASRCAPPAYPKVSRVALEPTRARFDFSPPETPVDPTQNRGMMALDGFLETRRRRAEANKVDIERRRQIAENSAAPGPGVREQEKMAGSGRSYMSPKPIPRS